MNNSFKDSLNNESKWAARLAYKCGVCGKEYEDIKDRAECELNCYKKQEEEKKLAAAKKKAEEQAARKKAVDDAYKEFCNLRDAFIKDYGEYGFSTSNKSLGGDNWIEKLYWMLP